MAAFANPAAAHDEPVIGAAVGATQAHETDHGRNGHRHYSRTRVYERHAYVAPARYNGNGTTVHCEPERTVHYRPTVVHVDDRPKIVRTVETKPARMKKVCRYVPVKTTSRVAMASR